MGVVVVDPQDATGGRGFPFELCVACRAYAAVLEVDAPTHLASPYRVGLERNLHQQADRGNHGVGLTPLGGDSGPQSG